MREEDEERYSFQTSQSLRTKTINDPRRLDHARDICETHYNRGAHLHCSAGSVQSANFFQNSNNFLFLHRQLFVLVPSAHDTILLAWWEIQELLNESTVDETRRSDGTFVCLERTEPKECDRVQVSSENRQRLRGGLSQKTSLTPLVKDPRYPRRNSACFARDSKAALKNPRQAQR